MKLENQVVSLDLAERLKELGVSKKSLYGYYYVWSLKKTGKKMKYGQDELVSYNTNEIVLIKNQDRFSDSYGKYRPIAYTYTCAELGEMLPEEIETKDSIFFLSINRISKKHWGVIYSNCTDLQELKPKIKMVHDETLHSEVGESLTNAMAKMLIYFIENNLIKIE